MAFPLFYYPADEKPPLSLVIEQQGTSPNHWQPHAFFRMDASLRTSGFLSVLAPDELKTLLLLLSFLNPDGRILAALPQLATALRQPEAKTRAYMERLCSIRFHDQAFIVPLHYASGLKVWTLAPGFLPKHHQKFQDANAPVLRSGAREAVIAHTRETYARPRAEVEAEINAQFSARLRPAPPSTPISVKPPLSPAISQTVPLPSPLAAEPQTPALPPGNGYPESGSLDNSSPDNDYAVLRAELLAIGLDEEQAALLQDRYDAVRIQRQLAWLPYRAAQNPAGLLLAAIKDNYEAPRALRYGRSHADDKAESNSKSSIDIAGHDAEG